MKSMLQIHEIPKYMHNACESGNVDLVKYLISLKKTDITSIKVYNITF